MDIMKYLPKQPMWYHHIRLSDQQRRIYSQLFKGLVNFSTKITITDAASTDMIFEVWHKMREDICELFYVDKITVWSGAGYWVEPHYCISPGEVVRNLKQIQTRTKPFLASIRRLRELQKLERIHDFLIESCSYGDPNRTSSHWIDGAFLEGKPVCEGFARAAQYLCDRAGILCVKVGGTIRSAPAGRGGHAWNIVWVGDKPYHMDVTFDAGRTRKGGPVRYDFFLLSDRQITLDRTLDRDTSVPACPEAFRYYEKKGVYYAHEAPLGSDIVFHARQKRPFLFQLPPKLGGKPVSMERVNGIIRTALSRENMAASWTLDENQLHHVYCILFH